MDDDMIMELGDAADYKSNPRHAGLRRAPQARFWPSGRGPARQSPIGFDSDANSLYNHAFSARGVRKNWIQSEVLNVRGHKNRRQAVQGCRWRKTQSRTDTG
ncbi:hypothetical protein F7R25_25695 [Burkholderia stagnalis]|uniref:Uncharacterized protein n=1 Tax=Burkholderia stagnalis TaxID=1503054 RepID=A0A6L3MQV2_9BURK|nr:hypothetical protein F7R25_25695 [Burkholderia stagnalis]